MCWFVGKRVCGCMSFFLCQFFNLTFTFSLPKVFRSLVAENCDNPNLPFNVLICQCTAFFKGFIFKKTSTQKIYQYCLFFRPTVIGCLQIQILILLLYTSTVFFPLHKSKT